MQRHPWMTSVLVKTVFPLVCLRNQRFIETSPVNKEPPEKRYRHRVSLSLSETFSYNLTITPSYIDDLEGEVGGPRSADTSECLPAISVEVPEASALTSFSKEKAGPEIAGIPEKLAGPWVESKTAAMELPDRNRIK